MQKATSDTGLTRIGPISQRSVDLFTTIA